MFISSGQYQSKASFVRHQLPSLIKPYPLGSSDARHNVLRYSEFGDIDDFVDPERKFNLQAQSVKSFTIITRAVSVTFLLGSLYSASINPASIPDVIGMTAMVILVNEIARVIFFRDYMEPKEEQYKSIRNAAKITIQNSLLNRLGLLVKKMHDAPPEHCRKLASMAVVDLKNNIMKMSPHGDKIAECLEIDNALHSLIETAKVYDCLSTD